MEVAVIENYEMETGCLTRDGLSILNTSNVKEYLVLQVTCSFVMSDSVFSVFYLVLSVFLEI